MLVLSRRKDETIVIGDDVEITIVDIRGDKVRLGITAPDHIAIHRKEVYDSMRQDQLAAGGSGEHVVSLAKHRGDTDAGLRDIS